MSFAAFLATIESPDLRAVAEHWRAAGGARCMPAWRDIDPVEIGPALRFVWAWRYDPEHDSFTGRLAGEEIIRTFERSPHGVAMRDYFPPDTYRQFFAWMRRVVTEPSLMRGAGLIYHRLGRNFSGERIVMPLSSDGIHGDEVIGATFYQPLEGIEAAPAQPDAGERVEFFALDRAPDVSTNATSAPRSRPQR